MHILAFQSGLHDASAAAFEDYRLVAAIAEERLRREKGWGNDIPWLAIDEVLQIAGWSRGDVDAIATIHGIFPLHYFRFSPMREFYYKTRKVLGHERLKRDLSHICTRKHTSDASRFFRADRFLAENGFRPETKIFFANHHAAHALAALFHTDWNDALIYTADGIGDNISYSVRTLRKDRLDVAFGDDSLLARPRPTHDSLATAYGYATRACGFDMWRHEGKVTGLSARGEATLAEAFAQHFRISDDGLVVSDFKSTRIMGEQIMALCKGHSRENIAASIQKVAEDFILLSVRHWIDRTDTRRLAIAGGLFANVRINRLLAEALPIDEIFIFPAMGDDGLAVGSGLNFLLARDGLATWLAHRQRLENVYFGRDYDDAIDRCFGNAPNMCRIDGDPAAVATGLLCSGKAGAIYAGRMEYGPRALGARSILASPARADINDTLNARLNRSEFMPFAPVVLEEDAERVFDITSVNRYAARFMTITCAVKPEWRSRIPAVVHVDGTARPQIVRDADNPLYADILRRFRSATGLPVLVNTSFNVHEEPIVNRPEECLQALNEGRVDFVVTRNAVTAPSSSPQPTPIGGGQLGAPPQLQPATGLYVDPQAALKLLQDHYFYWTGKLTESSFALSLAVIGANWAAFGSVDKVLNNICAEISIALVILSLGISLIGYWYLGGLLRKRITYAEQDAARWHKEFTKNAGKSTPWPLTKRIERLAARYRFLKTFLPVIGGAFFLIALFTQPKAQKNESHSRVSASAIGGHAQLPYVTDADSAQRGNIAQRPLEKPIAKQASEETKSDAEAKPTPK